jgi:hypothetical protein
MQATVSVVKQLAGLRSASLLAEILERRSDAGAGGRAGESIVRGLGVSPVLQDRH